MYIYNKQKYTVNCQALHKAKYFMFTSVRFVKAATHTGELVGN